MTKAARDGEAVSRRCGGSPCKQGLAPLLVLRLLLAGGWSRAWRSPQAMWEVLLGFLPAYPRFAYTPPEHHVGVRQGRGGVRPTFNLIGCCCHRLSQGSALIGR